MKKLNAQKCEWSANRESAPLVRVLFKSTRPKNLEVLAKRLAQDSTSCASKQELTRIAEQLEQAAPVTTI